MAISDLALLEQWCRQGDSEAFRVVASRHSGMVYATCRRILHDAAEAEDAAQECFERLALHCAEPRRHLGAWLHAVATNLARDRVKADARRKGREARYAAEKPAGTEITRDDIYAYVDEGIVALPEKLRVPLVLHFLEDQSQTAIAAAIGVSRQTVSYRIDKGLELVRATLKRRGIPVMASAFAAMMGTQMTEAAPATLTATLGKLAIASIQSAGANTAPVLGGAAAIGGGIVMKKVIILSIVAVSAITGGVILTTHREDPASSSTAVPWAPEEQSFAASNGDSSSLGQDAPRSAPVEVTQERKLACMRKLHQIGRAFLAWSSEHEGRYPERFSDLYPDYVSDPTLFACPIASGGSEARIRADNIDAASDYVLVTDLEPGSEPSHNVVVAYDKPDNHSGNGCSVLYLDGHVTFLERGTEEQTGQRTHSDGPRSGIPGDFADPFRR